MTLVCFCDLSATSAPNETQTNTKLLKYNYLEYNVPGLHLLCLVAAGGRCGAAGLLAELHQGLVVLLLLLLLLLVARQDEEETQDAL